MRVSALKKEMDERFAQVNARFAQVDARFAQVDARFDELERRIAAEGETTRRHFDIVAEQFRAEMRLLHDKQAASDEKMSSNHREHATFKRALDDHEVRIQVLERPRQ